MLDTKITGGTIIDGTGQNGFAGDVGIKDGRIVEIGRLSEYARETIDASGLIVAPGFIDNHTHYDAQVFWDPKISPSCFHGVTTIVGGFCGFSIAPMTTAAAPYLQRMLARVEGMPLETLQSAVPWDWTSFGEFLSRLDGKVGVNVGFFAGHSAIRRIVMGERAVGEQATQADIEEMKTLLDRSLAEGALGFSTSKSPTHNDGEGNPVPSRWASKSEMLQLARVVREHEGTGLELLPDVDFKPGEAELLAEFSVAGNRPVNWNLMFVDGRPGIEQVIERQLAVSDYARAQGGEVLSLTVPSTPNGHINLHSGGLFDALPGLWREIFKVPVAERIERFRQPAVRTQLAQDANSVPAGSFMSKTSQFGNLTVGSVNAEQNGKYLGRKIGAISSAEGREPIDVMLDIAIADGLRTTFVTDNGGLDKASFELRGRLFADDRTMIGGSDAGAHLDQIDTFAFTTTLLQEGVREQQVISLEQAIHQITQRPATYFGFVDRGVIATGFRADLVIFDPATVGRSASYPRHDIPGGEAFRIYADAVGIEHVLVNGIAIVRNGTHSGKLPGMVLRSGKDTRTTPMNALRSRCE